MNSKVIVIAEAGVNHNGDMAMARQLINVAAAAGADYVKFQTFSANRLVTASAKKAQYQVEATGAVDSQYQMLKKLELSEDMHGELIAHCKLRNIAFMSTGFDTDAVDMLAGLGQRLFKIPSGEINNLPYLRHIGGLGGEVILSTGMSTLGEVEAALDVLEQAGTGREKIIVLHCTTEYPAPMHEVNLRAMQTMAHAFGVRVGYSDHTQGIEVPVAAAALGAVLIEKHFTLDRSLPGPDHLASLEPDELRAMVSAIRNIEIALGDGIKKVSPSEQKNLAVARKSLVAACAIRKGELFTPANVTAKRPGSGISPMRWDDVMDKKAARDFAVDELIEI